MDDLNFIKGMCAAKGFIDSASKLAGILSFEEFVYLYDKNRDKIDWGLPPEVRDSERIKLTYYNFFTMFQANEIGKEYFQKKRITELKKYVANPPKKTNLTIIK